MSRIKEFYNYIQRYKGNLIELQTEVEDLTTHWNDISEKAKQGKQGEVLNDVAKNWLDKVERMLKKDDKLKKLMNEGYRKQKDQCCFGTCHFNPCYRYKCSKYAKVAAKSIHDRIVDVPKDDVTRPQTVEEVQATIDEYRNYGFYLRKQLVDDVFRKLHDDQVKYVGIFGHEGVGKTWLVNKFIKGSNVIMVEKGSGNDIIDIQDQIARQVHVNLDRSINVELRAVVLYYHLNKVNVVKNIICFDNVLEKFDLHKVGIPKDSICKILIVSREKSLCKEMGVQECNMFELPRLSENEARCLFWDKVTLEESVVMSGEYLRVADRLLSKCGDLPLAILTLARVLSGNTLEYWERFAVELERRRPSSVSGNSSSSSSSSQRQVGGRHEDEANEIYSILETSYMILSTEEQMMLLLCSVFPRGHALVQELMRCSLGLGLYQCVDTLSEAEALVNSWIDRLISSALVEEDDTDDDHSSNARRVKISDLLRLGMKNIVLYINVINLDKHTLEVEEFRRGLREEPSQNHTAISYYGGDHSRLKWLVSDDLQILILDRSQPTNHFRSSFFKGMTNLMVLVLKGMELTPRLPHSITLLKSSLRTLHLEECELGDITRIGELTNLIVLSLSRSSLEEIPKEIGNLCNLRLFDLTLCKVNDEGIPADVLSKLFQLQSLYALGYFSKFSVAEVNNLVYLKVFELHVEFKYWIIDDEELQFVKNLDKFRVSFGSNFYYGDIVKKQSYSRVLHLNNVDNVSSIVKYSSVRALLEKTQFLRMKFMWTLQHIFDDIQIQEEEEEEEFEFSHLQDLEVDCCPMLYSLSAPPLKAPILADLFVGTCEKLKYLFMEHDHQVLADGDPNVIIRFPCLKRMTLVYLPNLESATGLINDQEPRRHIFFNHKMIFPLLEHLKLESCLNITQIWEVNCKEMSYYSSFKNLEQLYIDLCHNIEILGSLSIATALIQLKKITIKDCREIREIISFEDEIEVPKIGEEIFPMLESVELKSCPKLKMFISLTRGDLIKDQCLTLSSLQQLNIIRCPNISFGPSFMAPKLNKLKIDLVEYSTDGIKGINSIFQNL